MTQPQKDKAKAPRFVEDKTPYEIAFTIRVVSPTKWQCSKLLVRGETVVNRKAIAPADLPAITIAKINEQLRRIILIGDDIEEGAW
jgi:hypothetical protein